MSYKLPFTESTVKKELCGRTLCYALNTRCEGIDVVRKVSEFELDEAGSNWRIEKGRLMLVDERFSIVDSIVGLSVVNEQVHLAGISHHLGNQRLAVYERSALGTDFRVVISSHVNYEADTVGRVVKSLLRAGVPDNAITVVVGGCEEDGEITQEKGFKRLGIKADLYGCTALVPIIDGRLDIPTSYVLLLHDTCEATADFESKIKNIDVGLSYDMIPAKREIGLWSTMFLKGVAEGGYDISIETPRNAFENLRQRMVITRARSESIERKGKDVYGHGVMRYVKEIPEFGIKKYLGSNASAAKA